MTSHSLRLTGLAAIAVFAAYLVGSRALDTGSWWEYGYTLALLVFGVNRFSVAVSEVFHHKKS